MMLDGYGKRGGEMEGVIEVTPSGRHIQEVFNEAYRSRVSVLDAMSMTAESGAPGEEEEIEIITPAMIEAGAVHLLRFHLEMHDEEDVVVELYRAMRRLAPNP